MRRILARMTGPQADPERARAKMVAEQLRARGITDERVLAAMGSVPREAFVPEGSRRTAYADEALPIDAGQTISQPFMVARMTQDLEVSIGDRILEIGTGSGYQAAILGWLGAHVTSLERQSTLVEPARERLAALDPPGDVTVRQADGSLGDPAGAPWDGIIVTAGAPAIPQELRDQLARAAPSSRSALTTVSCSPSSPAMATNGTSERTAIASSSRSSALPDGAADRSVYSPGHDPRLRRAAPGRRRALVRRPHPQPA
jgi:protein-L-isoaspartate(D-aspartate) O-methyltransferase